MRPWPQRGRESASNAPSTAFATRCISTSPTAGSAASVWRTRCLTTLPGLAGAEAADPSLHPGLPLTGRRLPAIAERDHSARTDGTWERSVFTLGEARDRYICPAGRDLRHDRRKFSNRARMKKGMGARKYRSAIGDCRECALKAKCCPNTDVRSITREKYEIVREFARSCTATGFNGLAQRRRKKVEMVRAFVWTGGSHALTCPPETDPRPRAAPAEGTTRRRRRIHPRSDRPEPQEAGKAPPDGGTDPVLLLRTTPGGLPLPRRFSFAAIDPSPIPRQTHEVFSGISQARTVPGGAPRNRLFAGVAGRAGP